MKTKKFFQNQSKVVFALFAISIAGGTSLFSQPFNLNQGNPQSLWFPVGKDSVATNKNVKIMKNAHILGKLKVGGNSLTLQGLGSTTSDDITSTNGVILLGGDPTFSNIQVGIGKTTPGFMLDVL